MTKQRKKLIVILSVAAAVVLTVAAVLAVTLTRSGSPQEDGPQEGGGPQEHTHTFSQDWTWNEEFHWHAATCGHPEETSGKAAHDYKNGVCGTCTYAHENHTFRDGKCEVCGLPMPSSELRYEEVLDADGQTVTGYAVVGWADSETDRTQLLIPAEHAGKPVVAVGESAFDVDDGDGDETLAYVYLPETVKDIGEYAFYGCTGLERINLEHVENVYKGAFYECAGLESAELGELKNLGQYAFYGCTSLKYVRVEGAETFDEQAFRNCPALERVEFGDGVERIPQYTFYESDGVRELSLGKAFSQAAEDLATDTFPDGLESIEVSADNASYAAEGGILYNQSKTEIVYVPKSIKGKVTVADGVTEIKAAAAHFMNHAYVTSLTIPSSVQTIQNDWVRKPFKGCYALAEIYDLTSVGISTDGDFGLYEDTVIHTTLSETSVVSDPDEHGFVWRTDADVLHACFGREKDLTLPDGHDGRAYAIGARAFYGSSFEKVTIPSNVTALGESAFQGNEVLLEVTVGEGLEEIGIGAFNGCAALTRISLPKSLKTVGAGAFSGCTALERADYAGTVSEWAAIQFGNEFSNLFVNMQKEKQATLYLGDGKPLPEKIVIEGIEIVGNYAFYGAPVREVVFGKGVKRVGQDAFSYCAQLTTVVIGEEMEYFYYAFTNGTPIGTFYFEGTQETWGTLNNGNGGSSAYRAAAVYFYSAGAPSAEQLGQSENWWHYGDGGEPTEWE